MEQRTKILGINKNILNLSQRIMLFVMLNYTILAPCQSLIIDVYGSHKINFNNYTSVNYELPTTKIKSNNYNTYTEKKKNRITNSILKIVILLNLKIFI